MKSTIISKKDKDIYLVQINKTESRILDIHRKTYFPPFNTQSIFARGYWEDYKGKEGELNRLLGQI